MWHRGNRHKELLMSERNFTTRPNKSPGGVNGSAEASGSARPGATAAPHDTRTTATDRDRFILRFKGQGSKPADDVALIRAWQNIRVLDDSSPRMLLVQSSEDDLRQLLTSLPAWAMVCERDIPVPDPRPRLKPARSDGAQAEL